MTTSPAENPAAAASMPDAAPPPASDASPPPVSDASLPPASDAAPPPARQRLDLVMLGIIGVAVALGAFWYAGGFALDDSGGAPMPAMPVVEVPPDSPFKGARLIPERPAPDFTLASHTGAPYQLMDSRGKVVLLFFGYTSCPDVCPMTLAKIGAGLQALGPDADKVQAVLVSVDPDRDTPEVMARYLEGFDPRIVGVTGDAGALEAVAADYGVRYYKELPGGTGTPGAAVASATSDAVKAGGSAPPSSSPDADHADADADHAHAGAGDYTMAHSSTVFVIDPQGQLRTSFFEPYSPDDIAHDIRLLLDEASG